MFLHIAFTFRYSDETMISFLQNLDLKEIFLLQSLLISAFGFLFLGSILIGAGL